MKLLMLKGLPASGKTTYARELEEKGWIRANKDDIRAGLEIVFKGKKLNEKHVIKMEDFQIEQALGFSENVVVDDTNLNPYHQKRLEKLAGKYGADFEIRLFDTPVEECIRRDSLREKKVGEEVIRKMHDEYMVPPKRVDITYNPEHHDCYIFDIDGTLAIKGDRSPYDFTKVSEDLPNVNLIKTLKVLYKGCYDIVITSGRDDSCREDTQKWLEKHLGIKGFTLFMRKTGDKRKDAIVKEEILRNEILPHWNVIAVFDDRDQVVQMWREVGLSCYQVNYGNF